MKYETVKCVYCKFNIAKRQLKKHINYCNGLGPRKKRRGRGQNWAKGKTFNEIFGEKSELLLKKYREKTTTGKSKTEDGEELRKKRISEKMKGNTNWENSIPVSGRGKKGKYNGFYYSSSWELAFIVYCIDHNISFKRNWKKFEYMDSNNKQRFYIPDFIINDEYYEIKGFLNETVFLKLKYFPHKIHLLEKQKMKPYLNYVIEKYGKNFTEKINMLECN